MPPTSPTPPAPVPAPEPTPPPAQTPPPPPPPPPPPTPPASHPFSKMWAVVVAVAVVLLVGGGLAYAFVQQIGPFSNSPYTEESLLTGVLEHSQSINSLTYKSEVSIQVVPRDQDALPFTIQVSNEAELKKQYENDRKRGLALYILMDELGDTKGPTGLYPANAYQIVSSNTKPRKVAWNTEDVSFTDPTTGAPYGFKLIRGGQGYELTATFETSAGLSVIGNRSSYGTTTFLVSGKTLTIQSPEKGYAILFPYYTMPSEPPKPFLVQLGEYLRMLPAQFSISGGVKGQVDLSNAAEWSFNMAGSGDFGDLTYAIDIDALKKDTMYYVRINKIPSIIFSSLSSLKGEWIHIDTTAPTSTSYSSLSYYQKYLPEIEENYRKNRTELQDFTKKVLEIANETGLVAFVNPPRTERIDGRLLYRYDLTLKKEAVLPFYEQLTAAAQANPEISKYHIFNDQGAVDYLKSDEFSQVFDYLNKYITVTWWVDTSGYLVESDILFRAIPPDTAVQLKDKQINLDIHTSLSGINKGVSIDVPKESKDIQTLIDELERNQDFDL